MGKKITLDFSKVEERSGWKTTTMPEGLHEMKVELVDLKDAGDGTTMWTYGLRPTNPKYKTRLFPYYCKHQSNQYFKLRDIFIAAGINVPKKKVGLDPDAPVGKIIAAEVIDSRNPQYTDRSEIDGVYDRSIIDDEDQVAGDEDDEELEEEEEADEVEDDEEYEEEDEEGEDELREEIEALTLAALRKRAKGLGIDTDGVKKDELIELVIEEELGEGEEDEDEDDLDEDDLDDEDLEDEDLEDDEDEEEEPEPAPRRRPAARKPAAKAPAKAAPKATAARRTVKRR